MSERKIDAVAKSAAKFAQPATPPPALRMVRAKFDGTHVQQIEGDRIRFISTTDGRVCYEVVAKSDGSLEIRGIDSSTLAGVFTGERLVIRPHVSNVVSISRDPYDK